MRAELTARSDSTVMQYDVDRLFSGTPEGSPARLPKGLSTVTMDVVVARLRELAEPCSATSLAEDVGLSRVSARRYLAPLVKLCSVRVEIGRASRRDRGSGRAG